jgi:ionotropic glutamate receptor
MVSSYTANLASFLTVQKAFSPIENVNDLIAMGRQGKLSYGAKRGGSTYKFFEISDKSEYKEMYKYMQKNEKIAMVEENGDGVTKAAAGGYAFLMESTTIEYITQRKCNLVPVGDKLDQKGYGIAMKKGKSGF